MKVTAVMKRFIERLVGFAYWPWGMLSPKVRNRHYGKRAVIVVSSAAPGLLVRMQSQMIPLLKRAAGLLGAKTIGVIAIGLAAGKQKKEVSKGTLKKARLQGRKLVN